MLPAHLCSLSGGRYAPDHLAILSEVVRLHQQRQRLQLAAPAEASATAGQANVQPAQQHAANGAAPSAPGSC